MKTLKFLVEVKCGPLTRCILHNNTEKGIADYVKNHVECALEFVTAGEVPQVKISIVNPCADEEESVVTKLKHMVGLR